MIKLLKYNSTMTVANTLGIVGIDLSVGGFQPLGFFHLPTLCNFRFVVIQNIESDLRKIKPII